MSFKDKFKSILSPIDDDYEEYEEYLELTEEEAEGLSEYEEQENFEEIITGLGIIMQDERLTLKELRDQCWEDSNNVFQKIYG